MSETTALEPNGRPADKSYQHKAVKYFFCIFGIIYAGWGIAQLVMTFTGPCAARWSVKTNYRGGGLMCTAGTCGDGAKECASDADCDDDLGLGNTYGGQYFESQFSMSILFGLALLTLGVSYVVQQWSWTGDTPPWDETILQVHYRFRPSRWVTWGIFYGFIFAVGSFYSGVLDLWLIVVLSVNSLPLHFLQSQNEALNTDLASVNETANPKTVDVQYLNAPDKNALSKSTFTGLPRAEAWWAATALFVVQGLVWFFHLGYANAQDDVSMNGFAISIPIVIYVVYFVLHVFVFALLTNHNVHYWDPNPFYREWFFILATFVIAAYTSIVSVAVAGIRGGSCSS